MVLGLSICHIDIVQMKRIANAKRRSTLFHSFRSCVEYDSSTTWFLYNQQLCEVVSNMTQLKASWFWPRSKIQGLKSMDLPSIVRLCDTEPFYTFWYWGKT